MKFLKYVPIALALACSGSPTAPETEDPGPKPKADVIPIVQVNTRYYTPEFSYATGSVTCVAKDDNVGLESITLSGEVINKKIETSQNTDSLTGSFWGLERGNYNQTCTATNTEGKSLAVVFYIESKYNTILNPVIGNKGPTLNRNNEYVWRVYADSLKDAEGDTLRTTGKLVWGPGWPDAYFPRDSFTITGGSALDTTFAFREDWAHFWYVTVCDQFECRSAEDMFIAEFPDSPTSP